MMTPLTTPLAFSGQASKLPASSAPALRFGATAETEEAKPDGFEKTEEVDKPETEAEGAETKESEEEPGYFRRLLTLVNPFEMGKWGMVNNPIVAIAVGFVVGFVITPLLGIPLALVVWPLFTGGKSEETEEAAQATDETESTPEPTKAETSDETESTPEPTKVEASDETESTSEPTKVEASDETESTSEPTKVEASDETESTETQEVINQAITDLESDRDSITRLLSGLNQTEIQAIDTLNKHSIFMNQVENDDTYKDLTETAQKAVSNIVAVRALGYTNKTLFELQKELGINAGKTEKAVSFIIEVIKADKSLELMTLLKGRFEKE